MPTGKHFDRKQVARDFREAVNMSSEELRDWLQTDESKRVGWRAPGETNGESIGHASGRRILAILAKSEAQRTDADYAHMRKVIGFVRRHRAQEPANPVTSRWRYSLMNWGHDPLKDGASE